MGVGLGYQSSQNSRMKVVQILYSGLGGHGSVAFSLLAAATSRQSWLGQLIFVGIEPVVGEYEHVCRTQAIESTYVPTAAGKPWRSWPALYRALKHARPDAIVLHSVKTILPCALYAARNRVPLIAVEHQANLLKRRSEWWVSRLLMYLADAVVVLTSDYREQLEQKFGSHRVIRKTQVIPNGIDTDRLCLARVISNKKIPLVIGMASRMTDIKRHDLLIDAIALLDNKHGHERWRLSLAGDGDTLVALRAKATALQLDDLVSFHGYLGEEALGRWFRTLDIYAHASAGETLSTSLLQAMAMGLPIVGSDVPGISNLLAEDGGVGLTVVQTPEAFAAAFIQISNDLPKAQEMGLRARGLAQRSYSQARMFQDYNHLLEKLCSR
jgi:glycosyltransferase involved in cell wall biosynthesis